MAFKHNAATQCYAHIPDSHYVPAGTIPFRSRHPDLHQHVKWQDMHSDDDPVAPQNKFSVAAEYTAGQKIFPISPPSDSSPTSVIEQASGEKYPPTPSPICSPSTSSIGSPRHSTSSKMLNSSELSPNSLQIDIAAMSSSGREEKSDSPSAEQVASQSPRNAFSSATEGGLLALLASKLFHYRDNRTLRHSGDRSETSVHDKHVTDDDRSSKPPIEEIFTENTHERTISHFREHRRTPSDTPSEMSLGSANERTLSMEFDAVLAAAVAAGIGQATAASNVDEAYTKDTAGSSEFRVQLPAIEENRSLRGSFSEDRIQYGDENDTFKTTHGTSETTHALVPTTIADDRSVEGISPALTLVGQATSSEESSPSRSRRVELTEIVAQLPCSSSSGSGRSEADVGMIRRSKFDASPHGGSERFEDGTRFSPQIPCGSIPDQIFYRNQTTAEVAGASSQFPSSTYNGYDSNSWLISSSRNNEHILPSDSRQLVLEKVRREKIFAQVLAFQRAKNARYENRYNREETKIVAWENQQRIKASINMKKVEMKLEEKRAKAYEKMQNEISLAHKKAEERKATAEARRGAKAAKVVEEAEKMKRNGKLSSRCIFF